VNQDGESEVSQLEFDRRLVERLERLYATRDVADDAVGCAEAPGSEGRGLTIMGVPAAHGTRDICSWASWVVGGV
jgi:hypothetical protein